MKGACFIIGDRPWHRYLLGRVVKELGAPEWLIRVNFGPEGFAPAHRSWPKEDQINWFRHFMGREHACHKHYGALPAWPKVTRDVKLGNEHDIYLHVPEEAELVFVFGCGLLDPMLMPLKMPVVNVHLGLSPRYRGGACLFWPFYFLEPTYAGATFHQIDATSDTGPIIHQVVPKLEFGDRLQDVSQKVVVAMADALVKLLPKWETWTYHPQTATGKQFLAKDFRAEHLRVVYSLFDDDLVDRYLRGGLACSVPKLVTQ